MPWLNRRVLVKSINALLMSLVFLPCLLRKSFKVRDLLTEKQADTWRYGVLYLCLLAPFFF